MLLHCFVGKTCQCPDIGIDRIQSDCCEIIHPLCGQIIHQVGRLLHIMLRIKAMPHTKPPIELINRWPFMYKGWVLIRSDYRNYLPKEDCDIWLTRTDETGDRWMQIVEYRAAEHDIMWDGTIAWMPVTKYDALPTVCDALHEVIIDEVR